MKYTITAIGLLCALLLVFGVSTANATAPQQAADDPSGDWARIQEAGKLMLGTSADYPPFEFYNSTYELDGFDIALAKALGEELGIEVEFNDYAFDGLLDQVRLGEVDGAIAAISVTPERSQLVDFANLYYVGSSAVVARSAFTETITSPSDMAGLKVGVERGTTHQSWAQQNLVDHNSIEQADLVTYSSVPNLLTALRTGKIDVALLGKLTADVAVRSRGLKLVGEGLSAQQFAIAVPKGSSLLEPLNKALLAIESDGRFAAISELYLAETPVQDETASSGAVVIALPTPTPGPVQPAAAVPGCIYSMKWVADINLDDQNMQAPPILASGQDFTKGWRVQNNGDCPWPADFELAYTNGNRIEASMGGSSVKVGREVKPGETIDINVDLRAPQTYGTFQGFWRMRAPLGQSFGETVWAGIQVPDPNPPVATPAPQPPASLNPNLRADAAYINAGQCTNLRWEIDNVRSVFLVDGGNAQGVAGRDARSVCPGATTTFTLRVIGNDGATHEFLVTVNVSGNAGYSINFWTDRDTIDAGQCTTLRWDVRNVQAVYLDGEGVAGVSQREVCPGDTRTYNLSVTKNDGGQESRQINVQVNNAQPQQSQARIRRFDVDRNMTFIGECVTLEWRTDDAEGIGLTRNGATLLQAGPGNGNFEDCNAPVGVNEYDLVAYNRANTETRSLSVTVQDAGD